MNYVLFDGKYRTQLLPFTFTRPIAEIRIGIMTIREKWETYLQTTTSTLTQDYLSKKFPLVETNLNVLINSSYLPTQSLVEAIKALKKNQAITYKEDVIALSCSKINKEFDLKNCTIITFEDELTSILNSYDIFAKNGKALEADFQIITQKKTTQPIPKSNTIIGNNPIFIEKNVTIESSIINTTNGSVYFGNNSEVMEGSLIRGPFALCEGSTVKLGAKIYGPTTIGPFSKVGGELNNVVVFGYSNKGHDGFLGNSVLGEWCNLGADTNNSNLKNNYAEVKLWNYEAQRFTKTGLQFCGLMMGDHSKCGINTMFNTGTVVGVSANIFGSGFPRNFIPSFSWGGASGFSKYLPKKAFETAKIMMQRRGVAFTPNDADILEHVFKLTESYRTY